MEAKQKAIKDHYIKAFIDSGMSEEEAEKLYERVRGYINCDGWLEGGCLDDFLTIAWDALMYVDTEVNQNQRRPKSLNGIESNRGWNKIEDGLPQEKGDYFGCYPDGSVSCFFFNPEDDFDVTLFKEELSHWQPITKPNLPLY